MIEIRHITWAGIVKQTYPVGLTMAVFVGLLGCAEDPGGASQRESHDRDVTTEIPSDLHDVMETAPPTDLEIDGPVDISADGVVGEDDVALDGNTDEVDQPGDADFPPDSAEDSNRDVSARPDGPRPVLFVHGVNGSADNFTTMIGRLTDDGWPADYLFAFTFDDPSWGCNIDNAETIRGWVGMILEETEQPRLDIVAHSMGTLSSRWYIKFLGGTEVVNTYVTLGGMHHGLFFPCLSPIRPCIWDELCETGEFIEQLNAEPATPGDLWWVSIYGTADDTVPNSSSCLEGAENIELEGIEHDGPNGLLEREEAYIEVRRVLEYPFW